MTLTRETNGQAVAASGLYTMMLIRALEARLLPDEFEEFLRKAGETRSVEEFKEAAASATVPEFMRLREVANMFVGLDFPRPR
jgi:hypothetical protein